MESKENRKKENERMSLLIFGGMLGLFVGLSGEVVSISIYRWAELVGVWYIVFHNTIIFCVTFFLFSLLADKINSNMDGTIVKRKIFSRGNFVKLILALVLASAFAYMYDPDGMVDFLNSIFK